MLSAATQVANTYFSVVSIGCQMCLVRRVASMAWSAWAIKVSVVVVQGAFTDPETSSSSEDTIEVSCSSTALFIFQK